MSHSTTELVASVFDALNKKIGGLEKENEKLKLRNMCDACAGTGEPSSDRPCMCGGTGLMSEAAVWLRSELLKAEYELERRGEVLMTTKPPLREGNPCPMCHSSSLWATHNQPCYYCKNPIDDLASDPGMWGIRFAHPDCTGELKNHHMRCLQMRLFPRQWKGWICESQDNPQKYCEYGWQPGSENCIYCGQPDERK